MKITGFNSIKNVFQKVAKKLFNKPIYLVAFLLLIDLVVGFILCWKLVLFPVVDNKTQSLLILNKNSLDKFVLDWEKQEKESNAIKSVNYQDIFIGFSSLKIQTIATSSPTTTTKSQ